MAWQKTSVTGYRAVLQAIVQMATSKYLSAVAINAAGTGYVVGDILSISHAGCAMAATVEVMTVSAGAITSVTIRNRGAFADRVASATVAAGGSGYAVGDILEVSDGTATETALLQVSSVSAGAVTAVTVLGGGGAYTTGPSNPVATTIRGPSGSAGTGATFNLTFTGLVGATGISGTGGTGSGATFDLTLTAAGWTTLRNRHDASINSVLDERTVVLQGTVGSGDPPIVAFRTYTATVGVDTRYGIMCMGMVSHNAGTSLSLQYRIGPVTTPASTGGAYILVLNAASDLWLSVTDQKIAGVLKCVGASVTSYISFYLGFGNRFGTVTESPFPMFIGASGSVHNSIPDTTSVNVSGIVEAASPTSVTGPCWYYRVSDATWVQLINSENLAASKTSGLYPLFQPNQVTAANVAQRIGEESAVMFNNGIGLNTRSTATRKLLPTIDGGSYKTLLVPVVAMSTLSTSPAVTDLVLFELDNVYWLSATKSDGTAMVAEDIIETASGDRYRIFQNGAQTFRYTYFAMKED